MQQIKSYVNEVKDGGIIMTIWNVAKTYCDDGILYQVLPYNLRGTVSDFGKMEHGMRGLMKFLKNSRLTEKQAQKVAKKKNKKNVL